MCRGSELDCMTTLSSFLFDKLAYRSFLICGLGRSQGISVTVTMMDLFNSIYATKRHSLDL